MSFEIKHPTTGAILQVAEEDFPDSMNWDDAMSAFSQGYFIEHEYSYFDPITLKVVHWNGWRLPNKYELLDMYQQLHKQGKGNFKDTYYWSSSRFSTNGAWSFDFGNGRPDFGINKNYALQVRLVRALPKPSSLSRLWRWLGLQ